MHNSRLSSALTLCTGVFFISACATVGDRGSFSQSHLPSAVQVPAQHMVALETVGIGHTTYECRAQTNMPAQHAWAFVGPEAKLQTRSGNVIGRYWGPPATWESQDGSQVTATQVATAPAGSGNLPLQLVKADPATGSGVMQNVTYIQRVATRGGVAPSTPCTAATLGQKQVVPYQADYIFWKHNGKSMVKPQ